MSSDDYDDISIKFMDKQKQKNFTARYFPNRQIATICKTFDNPETGKIETKTTHPGMNREDLLKYFSKNTDSINLEKLIRSVIYEAYQKEGLKNNIDGGNVRHFWYTHLKTIITTILGVRETESVVSSINKSWRSAINSGAVTYEEMDIYSNKESGRLSIVKDSPFTNIIIAVEKQNFFDTFQWIPKLFNCTLITAGGQPSRAVSRRFIYELKQDGVDLDQTFHMCVSSDLDCSGYDIQGAFKDQFDLAIEYYGGIGKVQIYRLFVRKDQVTPELLEAQGIAWQPDSDKKSRETKWANFCEKTKTDEDPCGGLYIPKPDGWQGDIFEIDGKPMVRALLEMDAFSTSIIEKALVKELLKIIKETNDETKIMIPEIMRVFNEIKTNISEELFERSHRELIEPLKKEFLKDAEEWKQFIENTRADELTEINSRYNKQIEEKEDSKRERVPELFDEKESLEKQIQELKEELDDVNNSIDEECKDIDEEISDLEKERYEEREPVYKAYNFRMDRYNQFNEEHVAVFNPVEQSLRQDIETKLDEIDFRFRTLEKRDEIRDEIGSLCMNSGILLDENISCFEHPIPTFKGDKYLEKASYNRDLNIGNVRDSFSTRFIDGMNQIWRGDTINFDFKLSKTVEMKDISQEVKDAMEKTEDELEDEFNE